VIFALNIQARGKVPLSKTKESTKVFKTTTLIAGVLLAVGALIVASRPVGAQDDPPSPQAALAACDTDKDGTIDENEVKTAAGALFDRLDGDKDGTLDEKELQGHMTRAQIGEADPDHDKTLTRNEYLVFARKAYRAADPDHDNTIDANELETPAGRALIILMQ
jgi:Ca2+-binding EF-hand superfamily protein